MLIQLDFSVILTRFCDHSVSTDIAEVEEAHSSLNFLSGIRHDPLWPVLRICIHSRSARTRANH